MVITFPSSRLAEGRGAIFTEVQGLEHLATSGFRGPHREFPTIGAAAWQRASWSSKLGNDQARAAKYCLTWAGPAQGRHGCDVRRNVYPTQNSNAVLEVNPPCYQA